jgi:hypothetical protein
VEITTRLLRANTGVAGFKFVLAGDFVNNDYYIQYQKQKMIAIHK